MAGGWIRWIWRWQVSQCILLGHTSPLRKIKLPSEKMWQIRNWVMLVLILRWTLEASWKQTGLQRFFRCLSYFSLLFQVIESMYMAVLVWHHNGNLQNRPFIPFQLNGCWLFDCWALGLRVLRWRQGNSSPQIKRKNEKWVAFIL